MAVSLFVALNKPPSRWEEFVSTHVPFSIALDGYVHGGP